MEGYTKTNVHALHMQDERKTYYLLKRAFDICASLAALILLSPLFIIVALLIKLESPGSAIYAQQRVGLKGKMFKIYKFRSMCDKAHDQVEQLKELNERDGPVFKITNDPRITKVGKIIRKTCIDELPQLLNVLKGEMSIVGPRPPLASEVEEYSVYDMQRLSVTPGLTCYWQINKGEETTFAQWVEMDVDYIINQSIVTDISIIILTFKVVLLVRGDN